MKFLMILLIANFFSVQTAEDTVSFTLRNTTLKSIPLAIPGVMNPNLSPMSYSGVNLKVGQEIFFFDGASEELLLTVSKDLEGKKLNVAKLIKKRKKELKVASKE